ncbi:hypothetical protein Emag_000617 [Eimeria magna]
MEEKERKRQASLAEEAQFRRELYAKFAREAKLEQLTQQKRMQAISEHNRQNDLFGCLELDEFDVLKAFLLPSSFVSAVLKYCLAA